MKEKLKVVVVGGGTAGWLSALNALQRTNAEVVVIESEDIGIIGAGEGTTPHFVTMLDMLQIPTTDLIRDAGATFKTCVEFSNWSGDGASYIHPFRSSQTLDAFTYKDGAPALAAFSAGVPLDMAQFVSKCSTSGKVPFTFRDAPDLLNSASMSAFVQHGLWGLHFDAVRVAKVLSTHAVQRGVKHVKATVVGLLKDASGYITSLQLDDGTSVDTDFVIDCTGMRRELLGKHMNAEWVSHEHYLPMDTAIPFTLPLVGNVAPKTEAIAMNCGWVWKIPVQNRFGCGYVYDSDYCTREQAIAEIQAAFGADARIADKEFKFRAGFYKQALVKNCVAVGLSQGFVEPLEATNIWVQCMTLWDFFDNGMWRTHKSDTSIAAFNTRIEKLNQAVGDFLHMHYLTRRNDTPFWQELRDKNPTPERVRVALDLLRDSPKSFDGFGGHNVAWFWDNLLCVASGTGEVECTHPLGVGDETLGAFLANQQRMAHMCFAHMDVLKFLGAPSTEE